MSHINRFWVTAISALALTASLAATADAAARPGIFSFHDCVGPASTPASFTATKENLPDSAINPASAGISFDLVDGSAVFVVQQFDDTTIAPGIPASNLVVTCEVDIPLGTFSFTGALTPRR
jgi:hypothetical protein